MEIMNHKVELDKKNIFAKQQQKTLNHTILMPPREDLTFNSWSM